MMLKTIEMAIASQKHYRHRDRLDIGRDILEIVHVVLE